ncbi:MAG: LamG domain-containing protein, partial [Candidatus Aenigmarchaeota archaeon]|nr:LamG domain-containing protein [Candidatus Aenigmarchaeota archaeon]
QTTSTASSGISQITTGMSQNFVIEAVSGKQITIRNTGQTPITNFAIYVDEKPVNFTNSSKIVNPGEIYTFFVYDFIDYSYPRTLKITIPGIVQTKQVGKENSDPSLIGYWKFDEGSGTIAYDSSIYGNDGIINDSIRVDGKYGKALYFTGLNTSFVTVLENDILDPKEISSEAWINIFDYNYGNIIEKGANNGYRYRIEGSGKIRFFDRGANNFVFSNDILQKNIWIYVVILGNASGLYIYINGTLSNMNTTQPYSGSNTIQNLTIGRCDDYKENFNGTIDEIRIWNRALTPEEVLNHYLHGPV